MYQESLNSYSRENLQGLDPEALANSPKKFKYAEGNSQYDSKNNSKESLSQNKI